MAHAIKDREEVVPLVFEFQEAIAALSGLELDWRYLNVPEEIWRERIAKTRNIPRRWTQGWGQGLALAFLAKVLEAGSRAVDGAL